MANPRQRRKARSSSHRPVSHSRHAKRNLKKTPPIRAPKALQDAWDPRKTVKQNYATLGLIHDLNPNAAGGSEVSQKFHIALESAGESSSTTATSSDGAIPKGFGKIIRDEAGNILRVEIPEVSGEGDADRDAEMQGLETEVDECVHNTWVSRLGKQGAGDNEETGTGKTLIETLERISSAKHDSSTISASFSGVGARHAAIGETSYLQRLVDKYGSNIEKMSRDRKLNPEQRTAGELKRALRRAGFESSNTG
ncbi:ribosome biogenesis protein Nop16 [Crucibulum laeve]|uniref:Nucleolar protein 16 n=1 Tax=Crucibulum laeve TaxID=68775 RepID=A0A5C3MBC1_9AGAR|nr:ribosome biogenesis protein Nop16 [Crucibulum laeve]